MKLEPGEIDVGETETLYLVESKLGTVTIRKLFQEESNALDYILKEMDGGATYKAFDVKRVDTIEVGTKANIVSLLLRYLILYRDKELERRSQHTNP